MLETIAKFGQNDADFKQTATEIVANTHAKSGNLAGTAWKNDYYDDMGWWALGWIASYDLTGDVKYLDTAKDIFEDMTGGWTTPCGGGIWWDKAKTSVAAIANELFLAVAAHLANRVPAAEKDEYLHWAQMEWDWFWLSGVINDKNVINDGIDKSTCKNDGKTVFTYNQGVILGGLSELARATGDGGYIAHAYTLAKGSMTELSKDGILTEPADHLDEQGAQFKGVFVRGLATLQANEPQQQFADYLKRNAESVIAKDRASDGVIGPMWQGGSNDEAIATSHASGVDLMVAAAAAWP
ncbi:glycoside hydrolase family 76 protein [Pleomassaria siparia CBS 279.74]|uniref:Glycoside hydrolase family 76 protein n=1 Tax=Pleomassaria siparia CBS 279.74 TaxID=1314801 RepID=A0A6G1KGM5_9PLEO|nr:glycoside hydrolase family 76 protein [Pleomassaria siparia CBS 279.74]